MFPVNQKIQLTGLQINWSETDKKAHLQSSTYCAKLQIAVHQ